MLMHYPKLSLKQNLRRPYKLALEGFLLDADFVNDSGTTWPKRSFFNSAV